MYTDATNAIHMHQFYLPCNWYTTIKYSLKQMLGAIFRRINSIWWLNTTDAVRYSVIRSLAQIQYYNTKEGLAAHV